MTIFSAALELRAGRVSSLELTEAALASIRKLNPRLNAVQTLLEESALTAARRADQELSRGTYRSPLHGIPVAVKDVFCTKGVATTCGSKLFRDFVPQCDAAVVEKLANSGAILVAKTGMHELAYGITSNNPHFGTIRNPWDTDRIPGGSSGGSGSAVASGMVFMAMGSDTGGSIRIPASYCGAVGLKPTFGRVSRYGVRPLDFSLDHMGPLARSVRDAALVLDVIAGHDSRDDTSSRHPVTNYVPDTEPSITGVRIGIPESFYFDSVDAEVDAAVRAMARGAESMGAYVIPVAVPDIAAINAVGRVILLVEASAVMEPYLHRRADIGEDVLALLDQGRLLPATDYVNAQRLRRMFQGRFAEIWETVDVLLTPTTPITAPRIGEAAATINGSSEDVRLASTRLVRGINVLGLPAISIPCGQDSRGLPIGLQIVGQPFAEAAILRVAQALMPGEAPAPSV